MCHIDYRRTWNITSLPKCWLSSWEIWCGFFTKKSCYHQGFFAMKRRAVFILGAMWIALVRGWRRDCVVGGMETRFQWRKAHNPYAKCEAFHIAPRLFFMFLFFIPLTIRQQSIIYPHKFSSEPLLVNHYAMGEGTTKATAVICYEPWLCIFFWGLFFYTPLKEIRS